MAKTPRRTLSPMQQSAPPRIYLSPPHVCGREKELLLDALESNWIAPLGPHVDAFEQEICDYIGIKNATALSSGTAALHLALSMLGVSPGDSVLTSTLTFVATANAIRYVGATPVFIDSNEDTWNMCPERLAEALEVANRAGNLPKAIVTVDLYGQCADYDKILSLANRYEIPVIEDAAEALGATYGERKAGCFGKIGVFSFNGNKIMTTSGGGMLVSDDAQWTDRARHLATQACMPVPHYEHNEIGYNYRLSNLLAAVGRGQLETLDERITKRQAVRKHYQEILSPVPGVRFMPEASFGHSNAWLTCILIDEKQFSVNRDTLVDALHEQNIEARPVWKPMHLQPVHKGSACYGGDVAASLFETGLCLPSGSNLSVADLTRVTQALLDTRRHR